jgi:hypothetical protein
MILGKIINVETSGIWEEDDLDWRVQLTVTHKRTMNGKDWEEKSTSVKVFDRDFDHGVAVANNSIFQFLKSVDWDLFAESDKEKGKLSDQNHGAETQ